MDLESCDPIATFRRNITTTSILSTMQCRRLPKNWTRLQAPRHTLFHIYINTLVFYFFVLCNDLFVFVLIYI